MKLMDIILDYRLIIFREKHYYQMVVRDYLVQVVEVEEDLELLTLIGIPSGFQEQRFMMVIGLENLKSHLIL